MNFVGFLIVCFAALALAQEGKSKKLQIGIKKRVENCSIKSKRGDLLHMHYTVGIYICVSLAFDLV